MDESDRNDRQEFDRLKLAVDSVKHITTLATGTIVLVAAFTDKLHKPLSFRAYLITTIALMLICLLSSFIYIWAAALAPFPQRRRLESARLPQLLRKWMPGWGRTRVLILLSDVIYFSFCLGIVFLGLFAIRNS